MPDQYDDLIHQEVMHRAVGALSIDAPSPDAAGQANQLARQTGVPPDTADRNLAALQRQVAASRAAALVDRDPTLGQWVGNPRNAAVASDNMESLAKLGKGYADALTGMVQAAPPPKTWTQSALDLPGDVGGLLKAFVPWGSKVATSIAKGAIEVKDTIDPTSWIDYALTGRVGRGGMPGSQKTAAEDEASGVGLLNRMIDAQQTELDKAPKAETPVGQAMYSAIQNVPLAAAALVDPALGLTLMGAGQAGDSYEEARKTGLDPITSLSYGVRQGATTAITQSLGPASWIGGLKVGSPFLKRALGYATGEFAGQEVATVAQNFDTWATIGSNQGKTFGDYVSELPSQMAQTAVTALTMSAITSGAVHAGGKVADRLTKSMDTTQAGDKVVQAIDAGADNPTRKRDPEAFRELMGLHTEGGPTENIFVPAEKVAKFFQSSDENYREDHFWGPYADQIDEGLATGGDVVIPTATAAAYLPGTKVWDAIKSDVRATPGGISMAEAHANEAHRGEIMASAASATAEQFHADTEANAPRQKIYQDVRDKLTNAGFTQDAAHLNAELTAQRLATRADRLGKPLVGDESQRIEVNQILPPALAPIVAASPGSVALKSVIAVMRGGVAKSKTPTLLDWIAKQGGIEDRGGDIAAMGAAPLKGIAEKGARKLIRAHADLEQGSMLGADGQQNTNSPDDLAHRAQEAGYFPAGKRPTVNDLFSAIDKELRGTPHMPVDHEAGAEKAQKAADELHQLLDQSGLDPAKASEAEIHKAIEAYRQQSEGSYRQSARSGSSPIFAHSSTEVAASGRAKQGQAESGAPSDPTKTPEFKHWFGESKAVDAKGKPLVLYHGTPDVRELNARGVFQTNNERAVEAGLLGGEWVRKSREEAAYFFTPSKKAAKTYTDSFRAYDRENAEPALVPVYMSLQNPAVVDFKGARWTGTDAAIAKAKADGHDGIMIHNVRDHYNSGKEAKNDAPHSVVVAFDPTQIKSVKNVGTFDPADPRILHQTFSDGPRGQISFREGKSVVDLFQARNMSTFAHEMGHDWLEQLREDAQIEGVHPQIADDWKAVQDWFKANGHALVDGQIPVDAHELWARGIERYLMEGKSPSGALRRVFDTFRSWLLNIYQVVDNLRSPVTPEIRDVMGRLLATDQEIAHAKEQQAITSLFSDAAAATAIGMSKQEFAAHQSLAKEAQGEAHDALLYRTMQTIRQSRTKAWQEEARGVKADVSEQVDRQPGFKALHLLRTGRILGDPEAEPIKAKLDRQQLIDTYGEGILGTLPHGTYSEHGMHSDDIADLAGFRSGDEMVRTLITLQERTRQLRDSGDKRSLRQVLIDEKTTSTMRERHGDPLNDGSIEEEALTAVHNDKQGEVIASDLRALSRRTGGRPTPYAMAKEWAQGKIASGTVNETTSGSAIQRYSRAAAKASRAAEQAMLKQDAPEAFRQKQAQMLNNALIAEAGRVRDQVETAVARLGAFAKRKTMASMDQEYLEQIHSLLEQVEFRNRSQTSIDKQQSFEEWARAREAEGHDLVVPGSFALSLGTTHWSRLTVEKLLGLDATVKQIAHLGRFKQELIDGAEKRDFNATVDEARNSGGNLKGPPPKTMEDPGFFENMKNGVASVDSAMLKMETVFDWLDGGDSNGVFNRIVFRPVADAQHRETAMLHDFYGETKAAFEAVPAKIVESWSDRMEVPFIDKKTGKTAVMPRRKLVAMALNIGNEGNLQRLSDGYEWGKDAIQSHLNDVLKPEEWQFVQKTWDIIGKLWPEIEAMEKRVNGVAPEKVAPRSFETPHGRLEGGYYPAIYDSERDLTVAAQQGLSSDLLASNYTKASTVAGATKERASNVKRPILLELGVINRHLGEVIHDITHREVVMQAAKFLSNPRVAGAVEEALGPQIQKQMMPWVKHVANSWANERVGNEAFGKILTQARANVTAVGLGFRATTILVHSSGLAYGAEAIGGKWMAQGTAAFAKDPVTTLKHVRAVSPEVAHILQNFDRDIDAQISRIDSSRPGNKAVQHIRDAQKFMFHGIGGMVTAVSVPVWIGGYNKALHEGMNEADARYAADKAVRQTMGTSGAKDLAAVQRGVGNWGQVTKMMTMFYTQMAAQYQRQRTFGRDVMGVDPRRSRDIPKLAARAFILFGITPILPELIKLGVTGRGPDPDESWEAWIAKHMIGNQLAPIPGVRDLFQPAWNKLAGHYAINPSITPLQSIYDSLMKSAGDAHQLTQGTHPKQGVKNTMQTIGYATGLVPGQVASATQFLVDVAHGDQHPNGVREWAHGLSTGTAKPRQ